MPQTINADLNNSSVKVSPSTLVHNGRLTICKLNKENYEVVRTIKRGVITGYSSTHDQTDSTPFITADGTDLRKVEGTGIVATNILPFNTLVRINGQIYRVADRMNARYNGMNRFDIWFPGEEKGKQEAIKYGAKIAIVEIVES